MIGEGKVAMEFDRVKNGYNRYQVDSELAAKNQEIDDLQRKLLAYKKQNEENDRKIEEIGRKYTKLLQDLDIKERAMREMTRNALEEANGILNTANRNADMIVKEALQNAKTILLNISKLGIEAHEIKINLNEQLQILSETIDGFDIPPIPNVELIEKKYKD